jgi:hypothetical protein
MQCPGRSDCLRPAWLCDLVFSHATRSRLDPAFRVVRPVESGRPGVGYSPLFFATISSATAFGTSAYDSNVIE